MAQKLTERTQNPNALANADLIHIVSDQDGISYKDTLQRLAAFFGGGGGGGVVQTIFLNPSAGAETDNVKTSWASAHAAAIALRNTGAQPDIDVSALAVVGNIQIPAGTWDMFGIRLINTISRATIVGTGPGTVLQNPYLRQIAFGAGSDLR